MNEIFSYVMSEDEDYYKILGCSQHSNVEQIQTEYKKRAILLHPDKNPDDSSTKHKFELLQTAKETLTNSELRSKYDSWLNSGVCITWKEYLHKSNSHQMMFHWSVKKPSPMLQQPGAEVKQISVNQMPERTADIDPGKLLFRNQANSSDLLQKFRNYQI